MGVVWMQLQCWGGCVHAGNPPGGQALWVAPRFQAVFATGFDMGGKRTLYRSLINHWTRFLASALCAAAAGLQQGVYC